MTDEVLTYPLGATPDLTLRVDPADDTTVVTCVVDAPTGPDQTLTVIAQDPPAPATYRDFTASGLSLVEAGTWIASWTITGLGHGTTVQRLYVAATPAAGDQPTLDSTTDIGRVRLLISDRDPANLLFDDDHIVAFLALEGTVRRAAAQALDTMASNEAMISKVIRTQDLQTDGSKVAAEIRARAAALREQDNDRGDDGQLFGMAVLDYNPNAAVEAAYELAETPLTWW
jgi:hypothetical protein